MKNYKNEDISKEQLLDMTKGYARVILDLGCGDGRFVYKNAEHNPDNFYIGMDPAPKQMDEYARKANRKKLKNLLFVTGSVEFLPQELSGLVDKLVVILPWGSLLKTVALPSTEDVAKITSLLKNDGEIEFIFGFNPELEPNQTQRLDLSFIDEKFITSNVVKLYEHEGFKLDILERIGERKLKKLESNWGKRLSIQSNRPIFRLVLKR